MFSVQQMESLPSWSSCLSEETDSKYADVLLISVTDVMREGLRVSER